MAPPKTLDNLKKAKEALQGIKQHLEPVVQRLKANAFERSTSKAQATVALSVGMMKYMGARLQGLDRGRHADDPLRKELNQMRKVLAEMKARYEVQEEKRKEASVDETIGSDTKKATNKQRKKISTASKHTTIKSKNQPGESKDATTNQKRKSLSPQEPSKKSRKN